MRLQKQLSRTIGEKEYAKYVVVIPTKVVEDLGWKGDEDLEVIVGDNEVTLRKKG